MNTYLNFRLGLFVNFTNAGKQFCTLAWPLQIVSPQGLAKAVVGVATDSWAPIHTRTEWI
jgi:hypothetical protein